MHRVVHQLTLALLLLVVPGSACADYIHFPGQGAGGAGSETLQNLTVGPGTVSITGSGNGTDQINGIANINGTMWANNFPGADIGAKTNNAIAALAPQGGVVMIPPGSYNFATTIQCPTDAEMPLIIQGAGADFYATTGTALIYTGSGDAFNQVVTDVNYRNITGCKFRDFSLQGPGPTTSAIGIDAGGPLYLETSDLVIRDFGTAIRFYNTNGVWTERYDISKTALFNNGTGINFHREPSGDVSIEHGRVQVDFNIEPGQYGIRIDGGVNASGTTYVFNGNMEGATGGTLWAEQGPGDYINNGSIINQMECNSPACTRFSLASGTALAANFYAWNGGPWSDAIAGVMNLATFDTGPNLGIAGALTLGSSFPASATAGDLVLQRAGPSPAAQGVVFFGGNGVESIDYGVNNPYAFTFRGGPPMPPIGALAGLPACPGPGSPSIIGAHALANNCTTACTVGGICTAGGTTICELFCSAAGYRETGM